MVVADRRSLQRVNGIKLPVGQNFNTGETDRGDTAAGEQPIFCRLQWRGGFHTAQK